MLSPVNFTLIKMLNYELLKIYNTETQQFRIYIERERKKARNKKNYYIFATSNKTKNLKLFCYEKTVICNACNIFCKSSMGK